MYSAYLLDSSTGDRISGTITVKRQSAVTFASDSINISLPLDAIEMKIGGTANRLVYFTSPQFPTITVVSTEKKILKDEGLAGHKETDKQLSRNRKYLFRLRLEFLGTAIFLLVLIPLIIWGYNKAVDITVEQIPQELEFTLGDNLYKALLSQQEEITDAEINNQLDSLLTPLISAVDRPDIPFKFHIVKANYVNAFAMPSGDIVFTSKLILQTESPEELLGVAAHEMAHITERHSLKGIVKRAGLGLLIKTIVGNVSSVPAVITEQGQNLTILSNSRKHEFEADRVGFAYLKKAQINPEGMLLFFTKLQKESPAFIDKLSLLSTHPGTGDRIRELKKLQKDNFYSPKVLQLSYTSFIEKIRVVTNSQNIEE